jgi:hypothetical protein
MRILLCQPGPEYSVQDVYNGWVKGFGDLGCGVGEFNLNDRVAFYSRAHVEKNDELVRAFSVPDAIRLAVMGIQQACYQIWPDVVVLVSAFFIDQSTIELMRARGHKIVIVHTESPYEDDRQIVRAELADLNIVNDPTNIDRFKAVAPTIYLPHCYDPTIHNQRDPVPGLESDFCFTGTGYDSRIRFLEQVDFSGLNTRFLGNWQQLEPGSPLNEFLEYDPDECCDNKEVSDYYVSASTSANLYRRESNKPDLSAGWAIGPREVELAACGTWFARDPRGEGDELFPMLPTFTDPQELGDLIRWGVTHPAARREAMVKAFDAVRDRTFDRNAAETLNALGF